jgi:hypothetical protein
VLTPRPRDHDGPDSTLRRRFLQVLENRPPML